MSQDAHDRFVYSSARAEVHWQLLFKHSRLLDKTHASVVHETSG